PEPGFPNVDKPGGLDLGERERPERGPEREIVEQRETQFLVDHGGPGPDDAPVVRIPSKTQRPADVDPPRTVSPAVPAIQPDGVRAPGAQPEILPEIHVQQIAVEPGVG